MARQLDPDYSYMVIKTDSGRTIKAEGTVSDPAATNDYDKGPWPVVSFGEIAWNGSTDLSTLEADVETKLKAKGNV